MDWMDGCMDHDDEFMDCRTDVHMLAAIMFDIKVKYFICTCSLVNTQLKNEAN